MIRSRVSAISRMLVNSKGVLVAAMILFSLSVGVARSEAACADHVCTVNAIDYQCDTFCSGTTCNDSIAHGSCNVCNPGGSDSGKCTRCITSASAATVNGTTGDDVICVVDSTSTLWQSGAGGAGDTVVAKGGDDIISPLGGNDTIYADAGNDTVYAGAGTDTVYGSTGADTVYGGDGADTINGGDQIDTLYGEAGDDVIDGYSYGDTIYGGDGNDTLIGGSGNDTIFGGASAFLTPTTFGNNVIDGGTGNDLVEGERGNDAISGGDGNDYINGWGGSDALKGGDGDDDIYSILLSYPDKAPDSVMGSLLCGGAGDDILHGYGPGHQCLDAGTGQVEPGRGYIAVYDLYYDCWYDYYVEDDPAAQDHDVGTVRNCTEPVGGNQGGPILSVTPPCGCE